MKLSKMKVAFVLTVLSSMNVFASDFKMEKHRVVDGKQSYLATYTMSKDSMNIIDRVKLAVKEEGICSSNNFDIMSDGTAAPGIVSVDRAQEKVTYDYSFVVDCK